MQLTPVPETWSRHRRSNLRIAYDYEVSVIVSALDEADNLRALISQIGIALSGRSFEIIIVDDASTDDTAVICEELSQTYPLRLVIRHRATDGLSGAVLHGMSVARGESWVVMDADLQHPPEKIPELLAKLESADFVIGSRYVDGASTQEQWGRFRQWEFNCRHHSGPAIRGEDARPDVRVLCASPRDLSPSIATHTARVQNRA